MKEIIINTSREDNLGPQLISIRKFLTKVNNIEIHDLDLNFSNYRFSPPLLSIFFSTYLDNLPKTAYKNISGSYLDSIFFPLGLGHDITENWEQKLQNYTSKTYLPLIRFSTSTDSEISKQRDSINRTCCLMIKDIANLPSNYEGGLYYLISEITDNIVEHSRKDKGWLSFQYYPRKGFIDLCIADSGRGLLNSYREYDGEKDFSYIKSHKEAIKNVIEGKSTKHPKERGYGVHTSRAMLVEGLNGRFIYISGNALLNNYELVDFQCNYQGTLLALRIPCKRVNSNFNYINFVE